MPLPPPLPDPTNIEVRLEVVAAMLERAVEEVRRAMAEMKGGLRDGRPPDDEPPEEGP